MLGAPAVVAVPRTVGAEPNWCTGLRKKAHLERWEFEAFNKHCSAAQSAIPKTTEAPAKNVVTGASIIGDAAQRPLDDSTSAPRPNRSTAPPVVPDKQGFVRLPAGDVKILKTTIEQQSDTIDKQSANKTVAQAERNVAVSRAVSSENIARSVDDRLSKCRYKASWLSLVAGLASLARAPKIRDTTQLLSLAAPLPFSVCDKAVDAAAAPLVVPASIGLLEGGDPFRLHVLEAGYTGSFTVAPTEGGILSVEQAVDPVKKTPLKDQFDIKALTFGGSTTVTVQDESGALKTIRVNIKQKSTSP
ncbi:MAG: hypothetical protein M3169_12225 [Candidatus Eremiobacteraeota bacterium]|nr:hypothetical protein [Candidatus Eremiobacteraeota bacterium]